MIPTDCFDAIVDCLEDPVFVKDKERRYVLVNNALCQMLGISRERLLGKTDDELFPEDQAEVFRNHDDYVLRTGNKDATEERVTDAENRERLVVAKKTLYRGDTGEKFIVGILQDITERRRSEELFRLAFDTSPDSININRLSDGIYVSVNRGFSEMTGYSEQEVLGRTSLEIDIWNNPDDRKKLLEGLREFGKVENLEARFRMKNGEIRYGMMSANIIDIDGTPHILNITRNITGRKQSEEDLRKSEERLRSLIDSVPFGAHLYELDEQDQLIFRGYNKSANQILKVDNALFLDKTIEEAFPPLVETEIPSSYKRVAITGQGFQTEQVSYDHGNIRGAFQVHAFQTAPRWMAAFFMDITERKQAEEEREKLQAQLIQAQKMESIGRLAGGVAHDFNNILTVMLGHSQLALMRCSASDPIRADLEAIENSAMHSANLVGQLLAFARKQTVAPKVLDLNDTVAGMLKMLQRLIGEEIEVAWMPGPALWQTKVDPSQVDQLLANLCLNARDAITGVGKITIETENMVFDKTYCAVHTDFVPGEYVMLAVSDNGCGIRKEDIHHIFEPFFTTKEQGKGTGLGLATVYGIVKQNGGFINLYSEPGFGSTFKIYLPRIRGEAADSASPEKKAIPRGSGETVLLVEDEAAILNLSRKMLETLGYCVVPAGTPGEALRQADTLGNQIRLLITDVVMPEMNGKDLAGLLLEKIPDLKCLFSSGYTADVIAHRGVLEEGVHFLQKPYSMQSLALKVREALDLP